MCRYNTQAMLLGHQLSYQGLPHKLLYCMLEFKLVSINPWWPPSVATFLIDVGQAIQSFTFNTSFLIVIFSCWSWCGIRWIFWCLLWRLFGVKLFPGSECSCSGSSKWSCTYKLACVFNCYFFRFSIRSCLAVISYNRRSPFSEMDKAAFATSYCCSCTDCASWTWHTWSHSNSLATCPSGWSSSWSSTSYRQWLVQGTQAFAYSRHL